MARFTVEIETDNSAFEDWPAGEVARILENLGRRLRGPDGLSGGKLRDMNGNTCGWYRTEGE